MQWHVPFKLRWLRFFIFRCRIKAIYTGSILKISKTVQNKPTIKDEEFNIRAFNLLKLYYS